MVFGFKLGDHRLKFPGFSNDFPTILNSADSPLKLIYYLTFAGIAWGTSFMLTSAILNKFVDPLFAMVGAIAFHTNPYIMSVFLSAPIWDFFPKILLFQYILIVMLDRYGLADRVKHNTSLHVRFANKPSFVFLIGATCASCNRLSLIPALLRSCFHLARAFLGSIGLPRLLVNTRSLSVLLFPPTGY